MRLWFWSLLLLLMPASAVGDPWLEPTGALRGTLPVRHWRAQRDLEIHKQKYDYSCGAASLATLLQGYFGIAVNERSILQQLPLHQGRTSFADLAGLVREVYGLQAVGYALNFNQLAQLRLPVLVYLKYRGQDHFSVMRGIDSDLQQVWLADPSWGNRLVSRAEFESMWHTRRDSTAPGKILLLASLSARFETNSAYFRVDNLAAAIRHWR